MTEAEKIIEIENIEKLCFNDAWGYNSISETIKNKASVCFLKKINDEAAGYVLGVVSVDECELYRIAVLPKFRRSGIAAELLSRFVSECKNRCVKRILLEVKSCNPAVDFYIKNGFEKIAVRKKYYGNDDALIFELIL